MSNNTPGPWRALRLHTGQISIESKTGHYDHKIICVLNADDEANARLITAAPELLETLKSAVENCGCSLKERLSGHLTACPAPEWEAVIAKAEGRDE